MLVARFSTGSKLVYWESGCFRNQQSQHTTITFVQGEEPAKTPFYVHSVSRSVISVP